MKGAARHIRQLREHAGLTSERVASRVGLTIAAYDDLETYDDEIDNTISLQSILALGRCLDTTPRELVDPTPSHWAPELISLDEVAETLRERAAAEGLSGLEARVGWSLTAFLAPEGPTLSEYPVQFLHDVGSALGIPWRSLVPTAA